MTPNFRIFLSVLSAIALMVLLSSCTFARFETANGTKGSYLDFHPTGNAVSAQGVMDGIGRFEIDRDTNDSGAVIAEAIDLLTGLPL